MPSNLNIDLFINPAPSAHGEYLVELREGGKSLAQLQNPATVAAFFQEWCQRDEQQKFLAYLIGLSQWSDPHALSFLRETCLSQNTSRVNLAAVAIDALSRVGNVSTDVSLLEQIALGNWDDVLGLRKPKARDREYLQRKALEALANLGDIECIDRLRRYSRLLK